jgi:hypothetical protein
MGGVLLINLVECRDREGVNGQARTLLQGGGPMPRHQR